MEENRFQSQPDHSHYEICCERMAEIELAGRKRYKFTAVVCSAAILLLALASQHVNGFSLLNDLMGVRRIDAYNPAGYMTLLLNTLLVTGLVFLFNYLGTQKFKFGHVILFFFYGIMVFECLIFMADRSTDILAFLTGLAGMYINYPAVKDAQDYKAIREAEGYPFFNIRITEAKSYKTGEKESNYESSYYKEDYDDENADMVDCKEVLPDKSMKPDIPLNETGEKEAGMTDFAGMEEVPDIPAEIPRRGDAKRRREAAEKARADALAAMEKKKREYNEKLETNYKQYDNKEFKPKTDDIKASEEIKPKTSAKPETNINAAEKKAAEPAAEMKPLSEKPADAPQKGGAQKNKQSGGGKNNNRNINRNTNKPRTANTQKNQGGQNRQTKQNTENKNKNTDKPTTDVLVPKNGASTDSSAELISKTELSSSTLKTVSDFDKKYGLYKINDTEDKDKK